MSIFPKRVTKNENVIIHLKFVNESNQTRLFNYNTQIISPSGTIITEWNDKFIMSPKSDESINKKEFYHEVSGTLLVEAGKYLAKTNLYIDGRIINSSTEKNDYFYVDDISIKSYSPTPKRTCYQLTNNSQNSSVKCSLIKDDGSIVIEKELGPCQCWKFTSKKKLQLKYENNSIKQIFTATRYMKNPKYDYRIVNNTLQLFDDNTLEVFLIPNILAFLWVKSDGLVTIEELSYKSQIDMKTVKGMLDYLIKKEFIYEIYI